MKNIQSFDSFSLEIEVSTYTWLRPNETVQMRDLFSILPKLCIVIRQVEKSRQVQIVQNFNVLWQSNIVTAKSFEKLLCLRL